MGHLGGERIYQLAKERFCWPGKEKDIKDYIKNKCICLSQRLSPCVATSPPWNSKIIWTNGYSWN